jgi:hypothetical protein
VKTLMPSSLYYIPSKHFCLLFIHFLIEAYLRAEISNRMTSLMKSGNLCFTSQLVGGSLLSAS